MIRWSPSGEISPKGCWTLYGGGYLYIADTLCGVLWQALTEWKNDRHLVG